MCAHPDAIFAGVVPDPSSDTAAGFPLAFRGAAGGSCVPPVTGSDVFDERTGDGEADGLVGGAQSVRVHDRGYCL
jgi:hypothetical protein